MPFANVQWGSAALVSWRQERRVGVFFARTSRWVIVARSPLQMIFYQFAGRFDSHSRYGRAACHRRLTFSCSHGQGIL